LEKENEFDEDEAFDLEKANIYNDIGSLELSLGSL
jgi:hypothetical protein